MANKQNNHKKTTHDNSEGWQGTEQLELLRTAGENGKDTATLESHLAGYYEVTYTLTTKPNNTTSRYLLKRNNNLCSHNNLHINTYNSFIHNGPRLEITEPSFN